MRLRLVVLASLISVLPTVIHGAVISDDLRWVMRSRESVGAIVLLGEASLKSGRAQGVIARAGIAERVFARWSAVQGFAAELDAASLERLAADPAVASIELDAPGGTHLLESSVLVGADRVHDLGFDGSGVTVAVIDSGVADHPDLRDRIVGQHCFCRNLDGTGCCPNGFTEQHGLGSVSDQDGHGTNVTGVIASAGTVAPPGIAPGVRILAIRVTDQTGRFAGASQVISAVDWILGNHPEVRVINMSLGTDARFSGHCDPAFGFAGVIQQARAKGVLIFASSGNNGSAEDLPAPACVAETIAVGAVFDSAVGTVSQFSCTDPITNFDRIACFTNSSDALDLLAPGAPITSTGLGGGRSTYYGTSQASPHGAAAAAILLQINPRLTAGQIEDLLFHNGRPLVDARNGRIIPRLDLYASVLAAQSMPPSPRPRAVRH